MIRTTIAALALLASAPLAAQSTTQDELDARYDRALAAGYKALFLCSAIANAERNGATRTPESVERWELTGIQAPFAEIVGELPYKVVRGENGLVDWVEVTWADDMPPRHAINFSNNGCTIQPISARLPTGWTHYEEVKYADPPAWTVSPDPMLQGFLPAHAEKWGEDTRTTAVLVLKGGELVHEAYEDGFGQSVPQRTWSVAKSLAASMIGFDVYRSGLDVTNLWALAGFAPADDLRTEISVDHLLRMSSGRYSSTPGNRTDEIYYGGISLDEQLFGWPSIYPPGTVFRYANNDTLLAYRTTRAAVEETGWVDPVFVDSFLEAVGMTGTTAETDRQANFILSSQVWSTARDLARLGQLYLDDGVLPSGERVLPEGWVQYVSSPSGPQPDGPLGYGAGFWLFNKTDGIPPDTFAMQGNRGQFVVIVPSRDIVIVRRGEDPVGSRFDILSFTRDVLAALES